MSSKSNSHSHSHSQSHEGSQESQSASQLSHSKEGKGKEIMYEEDLGELNSDQRQESSDTLQQEEDSLDIPTTHLISRKPWYKRANSVKLLVIIVLTVLFMVTELVVGFKTGSLALIGDAFHMTSDAVALVVAFGAIQISSKSSTMENTYGWQRAEVIGSFINGIFLLSVSLFIALEAIQRFVEVSKVEDPLLVVYVACGGVAINILGLILFSGGHGHSHGGDHGHAHGGGGHGHSDNKKEHKHGHAKEHKHKEHAKEHKHSHEGHGQHKHGHKHKGDEKEDKEVHSDSGDDDKGHSGQEVHAPQGRQRDDNIYAVFLHLLGDFLGSLAAIASGLLINFLSQDWKYYFDPALSLVIVILILLSSIPLVRRCISIFMQKVPITLDASKLREELHAVPGVISIHELHVWTLVGNKSIGSVHISCLDDVDFMRIAKEMKKIFHKHHVHSTTIQPEYLRPIALKKKRKQCQLDCIKDEQCRTDACCPTTYEEAIEDEVLQSLLKVTNKQNSINYL
eukprot:TRINITY_DN1735_c0_g2_i1.p1 TRINITY_DN1735_c0_g2~~TRINITY_DN1735_c0_g2_i1.p1  ORF type:complete len:511 (-),score=101.01 TRINITY_DN1735_c0_g2_i1:31-1563(-)